MQATSLCVDIEDSIRRAAWAVIRSTLLCHKYHDKFPAVWGDQVRSYK